MSTQAQHRSITGAISGYVLRLARESIPLTQAGFAEHLAADVRTVQGWESGRRPISNIRAGALLDLKRRLLALGADQNLVRLLDPAMDADRIIGAAVDPPADRDHPLSEWVHNRETAHMIAWAVNGTLPPAVGNRPRAARRGPVADAPLLPAGERTALFAHLREVADRTTRTTSDGVLLRRQVLYLTSYDRSPDAASWTTHALHRQRGVLSVRGWSIHWAEGRSIAAALARHGDPQPLRDFIDRALSDDDTGEAANLNYWAYWLGALPATQADDRFMADRSLPGWDAITLMRRLTQSMKQAPTYADLYAHSILALLTACPWLPQAEPSTSRILAAHAVTTLDQNDLSSRSRRELGAVHQLLRADDA